MSRLARAFLAFVIVVALCVTVGAARPKPARTRVLSTTAGMDLSGIVLPVAWMVQVDLQARARLSLAVVAQEAARRAAEQRTVQRRAVAVGAGVTGSCAAMAPPGFPGYVIQRESRGDPNASNGSHSGCVQIADSHFSAGGYCAGNDYQTCWRRMYEGAKRGDFPDPWACTPESGCG